MDILIACSRESWAIGDYYVPRSVLNSCTVYACGRSLFTRTVGKYKQMEMKQKSNYRPEIRLRVLAN